MAGAVFLGALVAILQYYLCKDAIFRLFLKIYPPKWTNKNTLLSGRLLIFTVWSKPFALDSIFLVQYCQFPPLRVIIPHVWHKKFSMAELQTVYDNVKTKLDSWSSLTLEEQVKKLQFEIKYVADPAAYKSGAIKYKTWEVAQSAYLKVSQEISEKWMLNLINQGCIYEASTASDLYAETVLAISDKKYGRQKSVLSVERERKAAQNLKKYLKEKPINPHYIWGDNIGGKHKSMLKERKSLAKELSGVTADDLTLVTRFSSGMTFYNAYNLRNSSAFWGKVWADKMSNLSLAEVANCGRIIEEYTLALDGIINNMKRYEGIVYRGVWGDGASELLSQFNDAWRSKSKIWVNKAAASSSTDIKVSYYSFDNKGDNDLIMIIKNKSGSYIRPISEYYNEKEVLLMKDVKYKVTKKPYILNDKWFVELEEI